MAGEIINIYEATDNTDIDNIELILTNLIRGQDKTTITEMLTTIRPEIVAGSVIDCFRVDAYELVYFAAQTVIDTDDPNESDDPVADGAVYVCFVYNANIYEPHFTATEPSWSDAYQGWYAGEFRALPIHIVKDDTLYSGKDIFSQIKKYDGAAFTNVSMSDPYLLTGTTDDTFSYTYIDYPAGYTQANTIVLSAWVNFIGLGYYQNGAYNNSIAYSLGPDNILLLGGTLANRDKPYKLLICRI